MTSTPADVETVEDDIETMPVFDTSLALKKKAVQIDGQVFTLRPLGAGEYLKVQDQYMRIQALSSKRPDGTPASKEVRQLEDRVFPVIEATISPKAEFDAWKRKIQGENDYIYRQVMSGLMQVAMPNVRQDQ